MGNPFYQFIIPSNFAADLGPIGSMYGIFTYIWLIFMVNVGKYTIHGSHGGRYIKPNIRTAKKNKLYIIYLFSYRCGVVSLSTMNQNRITSVG